MNQLPSKPPSTNSIVESIKQNSGMQLMLFMVLWLLCNMLAAAISSTIASIAGINDLNLLLEGFKDGQYLEHINTIKIISIASHLCQYLLPVVLYLVVIHNDTKLKVLYVDKAPNLFKLVLAVVVIAAIYPFISYVYYWNTQLIPKYAIAQDTLDVQNLMMQMQTTSDWAPASVVLSQAKNIETKLDGFSDTESGLVYLTHPLAGFYHRRDGKLGTYRVWHKRLEVSFAKLESANFGLLTRLNLVSLQEQQQPYSVLIEPLNEFTIYLPPQTVA